MCVPINLSDFFIHISGPFLQLAHNLLTVIKNLFLLIQLFPGLLIHLLNSSPVDFNSILQLLYPWLNFLINSLKLVLDVALEGLQMGFDLGDL